MAAATRTPEITVPDPVPESLLDVGGMPADAGLLREMYRRMVVGRRFDARATNLAKQGRLAVYPSSLGQEACQIGTVLALDDDDWLFPTYRDSVALVTRGIDPIDVLALFRGDRHCGYDPAAWRTAPQCTPLATQMSHAVGLAHAARLSGDNMIALAFIGDGGTSEGDFHEACNFAAVWGAPVVFLVQNNQYAISVPLAGQTRAPTLAHKGIGYGIPARLVDGNDVLAVYTAVSEAIEAARAGAGPTLIEAVTYRLGPHTNTDDPGRYREPGEVERWRERDPLVRLERYLARHDLLDDAIRHDAETAAAAVASSVLHRIGATPPPAPETLFANVYAQPTTQLREQAARLAAELELTHEEP